MSTTASAKVLADIFGATQGAAARLKEAALVIAGIALLAVSAKVAVPMWPVPITMGTFAVLTIGAAYGARLGLVTILGYMLIGAAGFDVFAGSSVDKNGLGYMMGGTGGYLLGYVLATAALGWFAARGWDRSAGKMALAMLAGNALIYIPGLIWLNAMPYAESWGWTVQHGLTPFLIGDVLKLALAAVLFPAVWTLSARLRG
jgi:biotin transport system substrate-specific component